MLSAATIATVKATVPALQAHGETLTRHFYAIMLRDHPEVRPFFNPAHQASGAQARALAGAVVAYAQHIDRLQALAGAVPTIVHKHVALGVQPEHYPVVGKCLLQAIREVLGDAATEDILQAWAEAYQALANLLIQAEAQVYEANAAQPGGWRGERAFRVARREAESALITSFYLEPVDGGALPSYQPGQYLTVLATIDGEACRRNYSLSDAPGKPWLRISVKREAGGKFSNWLHDRAEVGTELSLMAPCGEFVLDGGQDPLVLVTGGVGLTPAMAMLEAVVPTGRPVHFLHAARDGAVHAFRARVDALAAAHPNLQARYVYDAPRPGDAPHATGLMTEHLLADWLPATRDVQLYCLGPVPFMQAVLRHARRLGVAAERLHVEFFGPKQALAIEDAAA